MFASSAIPNQASNYNIWYTESNLGSLEEVFEFFGQFSFALCLEHDGLKYDSVEVNTSSGMYTKCNTNEILVRSK